MIYNMYILCILYVYVRTCECALSSDCESPEVATRWVRTLQLIRDLGECRCRCMSSFRSWVSRVGRVVRGEIWGSVGVGACLHFDHG